MSDNVTMAEVDWGSRHRSCSIDKVENGYEIKAQFPCQKQERYDPGKRQLVFVFASVSETIGWTNWYFTEDAERLAEQPPPIGPTK